MANFRIFLEVNFNPLENAVVLRINWLRNMPMNIAITAEPMTWMGSKLSNQQARTAITADRAIPGISLRDYIRFLLIFCIVS